MFGEEHACLGGKPHGSAPVGVWAKTDLPWASDDHPMLELAHAWHIGAPWSATNFYTCDVYEKFEKTMHAWVDTQLTCSVWAKTDLPWVSDNHTMLEIAHDLHIGAPWSATHFYTCDFNKFSKGKTMHAWVDI